MPKTEFEAFGTVVTSAFCQAIYGGSPDKTLSKDDPLVSGHKHDGVDKDGHCGKIEYDHIDEDAQKKLKEVIAKEVRENFFPLGTIMPYAGTNAPDGYLFCNGSEVNTDAKYDDFRSWIRSNATHLFDNNSGKFYTPDLRGRVPVGLDTNREYSDELGKSDGEHEVVLGVGTLPYHTHRVEYTTSGGGSDSGSSHASVNTSSNRKWLDNNDNTSTDVDTMSIKYQSELNSTEAITKSAGTDEVSPHNNLQPYYVVNYIIRAMK
jgi:microcystin-dependent protein